MADRVFSGIQPSGALHIGNYLGAIRNWVAEQDRFDNIFCIVDLHAITVPQDPTKLKEAIRQLAMIYLAAGLDPERVTIFVQSDVSAHAEGSWILNCVTPIGWLERMTQFKDKAGRAADRERISTGLLDYPVLMAADILLYHAKYVPVGDDQRQHVELARDIAQRFNNLFGETFTLPEAQIKKVGARIMGLDDPAKKMSKSESNPNHAIFLLDSPDAIRKKVSRATTDSGRDIVFDPMRPGIYNLLSIYELLSGEGRAAIEARFEGKGYGDFKKALAEVVVEGIRPLQERFRELERDPEWVDAVLWRGAERARAIAEPTLRTMMGRVGLGSRAVAVGVRT